MFLPLCSRWDTALASSDTTTPVYHACISSTPQGMNEWQTFSVPASHAGSPGSMVKVLEEFANFGTGTAAPSLAAAHARQASYVLCRCAVSCSRSVAFFLFYFFFYQSLIIFFI